MVWIGVFITVSISILLGVSTGLCTVYLLKVLGPSLFSGYHLTGIPLRLIIGIWILFFIVYFLFQIYCFLEGKTQLEKAFMGSAKKAFLWVILSWAIVIFIAFIRKLC